MEVPSRSGLAAAEEPQSVRGELAASRRHSLAFTIFGAFAFPIPQWLRNNHTVSSGPRGWSRRGESLNFAGVSSHVHGCAEGPRRPATWAGSGPLLAEWPAWESPGTQPQADPTSAF